MQDPVGGAGAVSMCDVRRVCARAAALLAIQRTEDKESASVRILGREPYRLPRPVGHALRVDRHSHGARGRDVDDTRSAALLFVHVSDVPIGGVLQRIVDEMAIQRWWTVRSM